MSEFQYYEWQTIDRSLTAEEQAEVGGLSSHIQVTSTYAQVDYSWGSFKHKPKDVLAQYFDAFLYMANWGSRQVMFRFPKALLDTQRIMPYCVDYHVTLESVGDHVILVFDLEDEEPGDWIEGEGWLSTMARLRDDILRGDDRVLYLAWLRATELDYDLDEAAVEPPVPPGLGEQTASLETFAQFFEIDPLLVRSAASVSEEMPQQPSAADWRTAIATLSRSECDRYLLRLVQGEPHIALELKKRLQQQLETPSAGATSPARTVGDIHARKDDLINEARHRQREAAEARRLAELAALAERKDETWQDVERLILSGKSKAYDEAAAMLVKLSELAMHQGDEPVFEARIADLRARYPRKRAFLERLRRAGL